MSENKNIISRLQRWMDSVPGQSFLNYAYSWGAAIVILGALFKLTHIKGADFMLFLGMSTEVFVFILSGFDRPFDTKKQDKGVAVADDESWREDNTDKELLATEKPDVATAAQASVTSQEENAAGVMTGLSAVAALDTQKLIEIVQESNKELMAQAQAACSPEIGDAAQAYVEELRELTKVLEGVREQVTHLTQDSDEMDKLNRTLTSINTIYEMQLKSVSLQIGTIDHINEQTRQMAHLIEELNGAYTRMIQALTVNMKQTEGQNPG